MFALSGSVMSVMRSWFIFALASFIKGDIFRSANRGEWAIDWQDREGNDEPNRCPLSNPRPED